MRHEMSLRGGIFNGAVNLFDDKLRGVLNDLLRQGLSGDTQGRCVAIVRGRSG